MADLVEIEGHEMHRQAEDLMGSSQDHRRRAGRIIEVVNKGKGIRPDVDIGRAELHAHAAREQEQKAILLSTRADEMSALVVVLRAF